VFDHFFSYSGFGMGLGNQLVTAKTENTAKLSEHLSGYGHAVWIGIFIIHQF
jgi:hypothetical protein